MVLAVSNLIANAVKFTEPGGTVSAEVRPLDGGVQFAVRDSGPGIDAEDLPRVFERFYRGRSAASLSMAAGAGAAGAAAEGAGLGLAIVQSVARAHGGQVRVESAPDAGSTFVIEIPDRLPVPPLPFS